MQSTGIKHKMNWRAYLRRYWVLYLFVVPALLDVLIFRYVPMYGVQIAFRNYKVRAGIWGSEWVDFEYILDFINSPMFGQLMRNTLLLSLYQLAFGFPVPIILAFMLNEMRCQKAKRFVQMATYAPHFISMVAVVGLLQLFLQRDTGVFNLVRALLGMEQINYLAQASSFRSIYVLSGIWQEAGWGTIIYLAALSGVNVDMLDACAIDGATRFQKIIHIDLPTILPTVVVLLILNTGSILNIGFEKVFLMQNDLNRDVSELISTYTYRLGIQQGRFSKTAAIGLFNSVVSALVLVIVNALARKVGETSLW